MIGGKKPHGYTIFEMMIVLVVTTALFVGIASTVNGQQQRNQFVQSVRDVESTVQDIMNDVSTGFYSNPGNIICDADPDTDSAPNISSGAASQGTNKNCIFIGRVIQFAPQGSNGEAINIISVAGRRQTSTKEEVGSFSEAKPRAIKIGSAIETKRILYGVKVKWVKYGGGAVVDIHECNDKKDNDGDKAIDGADKYCTNKKTSKRCESKTCTPSSPPAPLPPASIGAIGFFSDFGIDNNAGGLQSGSLSGDIVPIDGTALDNDKDTVADRIADLATAATLNPETGITVCLESGGSDQYAELLIGGSGRFLSTKLDIKSGLCP